ncbi:hypothetical protein [Desulfopila sp. IMCC35008]|uniref:hypothetical protein n=1 Tax=Desulfopila sp. IMCC35008 TaxID=2653858 RepID=UPI00271485AD|nr:hypothetical protein [Desulfopila sp. IMCC35008]
MSFKTSPTLNASPGHKFQHEVVTLVCGPKDNLVNRILVNDLPLNGWWALEDLFDDCGIAGVGEGWQACVDTEVVKRREDGVAISLRGLLVVLCQGQKEIQYLFLGYTG